MDLGYTLMCEQSDPRSLVRHASDAEATGFDFVVISDHAFPWLDEQPVSFDRDQRAAIRRAHEQFRWFGGGWKVNAELPGTAGFTAASQFVTEDDVARSIPCGDDVDAVVKAAAAWADAGFTHLALVQIGGDAQEPFLEWSHDELLPALRSAKVGG